MLFTNPMYLFTGVTYALVSVPITGCKVHRKLTTTFAEQAIRERRAVSDMEVTWLFGYAG